MTINGKEIILRDYYLIAAFLMIPFGVISFGLIHRGHHLFIIFSMGFILAGMIRNVWLSSFLAFATLWQFFITLYCMAVPEVPAQVAINAMSIYQFMVAGAIIGAGVYYSKLENEIFYNVICIATIIQLIIGYMQLMGADPFLWLLTLVAQAKPGIDIKEGMTGTLGNPNFLSMFFAISLPFFFRRRWIYAVPFIIIAMLTMRTSTSVVAAMIGLSIYFDKLKYTAGFLLLAVGFVLYDGNVHTNDRVDMWREAIQQVNSTWFTFNFGMGPGAGWGRLHPMHSEWVQTLHQFGVVGIALIGGYVATIHRGNKVLFTAFVIACVGCLGVSCLHYAPPAFLIMILMGLIERERDNGLCENGSSAEGGDAGEVAAAGG